MRVSVFRGVVAAVALVLLLCIGAFFMQSRFDSSSDEGQAPIPGAEEFAQPAAPLPDDLVALRPATAAKGGWEGLLVRELGRQAVLIAARDEMGLRTRDVTLREILPDADFVSLRGLDAHVISPPDGTMFIGIDRTGGEFGKIDFVKIPEGKDEDRIAYVAQQAEAASHDALVERLEGLGYKSRKDAPADKASSAAAEPSPKVAEQFDLISQYAAARAWHNAIRAYGETAERLAGLVRAYSNLGLLTSHHWSAAQKAFQARSLLYAERLLRLTGETPNALRSRAYARALIGLPMLAVADLETADDAGANETAPDWCAVVRAYAAGDAKDLERRRFAGDKPSRCLACVFVLNDALLSTSPVRIEEAATALLGLVPPNNLANFALLSGPMPLDVLRSNVDRIQMGSRDWLYEPLAASGVPIPLKIASVPEEPEAEAAFCKKLLDDLMSDDRLRGNDSEPSLVAVGRLIEEEGIMHAQDILTTYKSVLGLDVEEKYRNTLPWYSHHPYRQLMNGYGPFEERSGAVAEVGRKMMFEQLLPSGQEIHDLFVAYSRGPEAAQGIRLIRANSDEVERDLVWRVAHPVTNDDPTRDAATLERISPNALATARCLVTVDPGRVVDRIPEWERRFSGDVAFMKALAQWHYDEMRFDDAIRCMNAAAYALPEFEAYEWIASIYDAQAKDKEYIQTYADWLEERSHGLEHATAAMRISDRFCRQERWQDALAFALRAAESYSGWGLRSAGFVLEALGEFEQAEAYVRASSERYTSDAGWYRWCVRTGHGDLAAAERAEVAAQAEWRQTPNYINFGADYDLAFSMYLHGQRQEALAGWRTLAEQFKQPLDAMFVALVADELGDTATRDEFLTKAYERCGTSDVVFGELVRALREDLANGSLDVAELGRFVRQNSFSSAYAGSRLYLLAWYLTNRGREEEALPYCKIVASAPDVDEVTTVLAGRYLTTHGHDPVRRAGSLVSDEMLHLAALINDGSRLTSSKPMWALLRFDEVLKAEPRHVVGLQWRAHVLTQQERFHDAVSDYDVLIAEMPRTAIHYLGRGTLHARLGDEAKAVADFEQAVDLARSQKMRSLLSNGLLSLAMMHAAGRDSAVSDPVRALQLAEEAIALGLAPECEQARVKAIALAAGDRFDEAIELVEPELAQCDESVRPWMEYQLARYRRHERYIRPDGWWRATPVAAGPVEAPRR